MFCINFVNKLYDIIYDVQIPKVRKKNLSLLIFWKISLIDVKQRYVIYNKNNSILSLKIEAIFFTNNLIYFLHIITKNVIGIINIKIRYFF